METGVTEEFDTSSEFDAAVLPMFALLKERLQDQFDLIKVWRFFQDE